MHFLALKDPHTSFDGLTVVVSVDPLGTRAVADGCPHKRVTLVERIGAVLRLGFAVPRAAFIAVDGGMCSVCSAQQHPQQICINVAF